MILNLEDKVCDKLQIRIPFVYWTVHHIDS